MELLEKRLVKRSYDWFYERNLSLVLGHVLAGNSPDVRD